MRKARQLLSDSNSEIRAMVAKLGGVSFDHVREELDKRIDDDLSFEDLAKICGHPLTLAKDAAGNTPLHFAAEGGYLSLCQLLTEYGANVNMQNNAGETP